MVKRGLRGAITGTGAALVGTLVALSGCSPDYRYVTDPPAGVYLKLPRDWATFDQAILARSHLVSGSLPFLEVFAAGPHADPHSVFGPTSRPWGLLEVADISASQRLGYSFDSLLNAVVPIDQITSDPSATVVPAGPEAVITRGPLRGVRGSFRVSTRGAAPFQFEQLGLVNPATSRSWILLVGCSPACFAAHSRAITGIVGSWTVQSR